MTFIIGPTQSNYLATTSAASILAISSQIPIQSDDEFIAEYKLKLAGFVASGNQQYACPSTLTKKQRAIVHRLAEELNL